MSVKEKATLPLLLKDLRLSTMGKIWEEMATCASNKGWSHIKYLAELCEQEMIDRQSRRLARRMKEANLPKNKTIEAFDFSTIPSINRSRVGALSSGDVWIEQGRNLLMFGPSGVGKTHLAAAIGEQLVQNGFRVLFSRTTELVQKLQAAKRDLNLPSVLDKLDRYDCLILDDFGYVKKNELETSVLFELICERYERRSLIITCNQPFKEWDQIFEDRTMAVAAIDRLVHHADVVEMCAESYRKKTAIKKAEKKERK